MFKAIRRPIGAAGTDVPELKIRPYECRIEPEWITSEGPFRSTIMAATAGKARYECLLNLRDAGYGFRFQDIRVRSIDSLPAAKLAAFARTAAYRGVPFARIGMKVQVGPGYWGIIAGKNSSANFDVYFTDGPHKGLTLNCHPNWQMKYFAADGSVLAYFS